MAALTVFTCTSATAAGTVATYTGTITAGASPLVIGMPIIVVGFVTHTNFNGNLVITGGNLTTTFTATIPSTTATDTHAATATVDPEGVSVYPTDIASNTFGYGIFARFLAPLAVPLGNGTTGGNVSGVGQLFPTGQQ